MYTNFISIDIRVQTNGVVIGFCFLSVLHGSDGSIIL